MADDPIETAVRQRLSGGPRAELPVIGDGAGAVLLPVGRGRGGRSRRAALVAAGVAVALLVVGGGVALAGRDDGSASADDATPSPRTDAAPSPRAATTTSRAPSTTTAGPATTTTGAPSTTTTLVPVASLPRHEAVYRAGKLVLQGTLPDRKVADALHAAAAEVIGAENVVDNYQLDPRVPTPTDGRVRVDEAFLFATDSAEVDPAYLPVFDLGVAALRLNPQATIQIVGHTDDRGPAEVNRALSLARAQAAADYLVAKGIDPARIEVRGLGPDQPRAANDTPEGRAENRRIEITLLGLLG